uniref:Basic leucine zipper ATF-like transcription factor n=1 Tax=Sinocyclocheilus grahami TaxID=75366 RepID=A0A672RJI0_SINGR
HLSAVRTRCDSASMHTPEVHKQIDFSDSRRIAYQWSLLNVFYFLFVLQESENLEKENAALRKEVKRLTEEAKYLSTVLSNHEPLCTGLSGASTYGTHHGAFHQHISVPHYPL